MRKLFAFTMPFVVLAAALASTTSASAETYQFKMWIAPLECTRSEVIDGTTVTTIITPQECDDLLNPPVVPPGPITRPGESPVAPQAPDTGAFNDTWTTVLGIIILLVVLGSVLYILLSEVWPHLLRKRKR